VQSLATQQLPLGMQLLLALQIRWPLGQEQTPPEHFSPTTGQSESLQQLVLAMQIAPHSLEVDPQKQLPALQIPSSPQSVSLQQPLPDWHAPLHTRCPLGHWQVPEQNWPGMVQSASEQQLAVGMQLLLARQIFWPPGQPHWPFEPHIWPLTLQSEPVQQLPPGMQELLALHAFCPPGHWHEPPEHCCPDTEQSLLLQQFPCTMHAPLQILYPPGHWQVPLMHCWPPTAVHSVESQQPLVGAQPVGLQALSPALSKYRQSPVVGSQTPICS
jgi:hypothetical protein